MSPNNGRSNGNTDTDAVMMTPIQKMRAKLIKTGNNSNKMGISPLSPNQQHHQSRGSAYKLTNRDAIKAEKERQQAHLTSERQKAARSDLERRQATLMQSVARRFLMRLKFLQAHPSVAHKCLHSSSHHTAARRQSADHAASNSTVLTPTTTAKPSVNISSSGSIFQRTPKSPYLKARQKLKSSPVAPKDDYYTAQKKRQQSAYQSRLQVARMDLERREATALQALARGYLVRREDEGRSSRSRNQTNDGTSMNHVTNGSNTATTPALSRSASASASNSDIKQRSIISPPPLATATSAPTKSFTPTNNTYLKSLQVNRFVPKSAVLSSSSTKTPIWATAKLRSTSAAAVAVSSTTISPTNHDSTTNQTSPLTTTSPSAATPSTYNATLLSPTEGYKQRKQKQKTAYQSRLEAARADLERREATVMQALARGYLVRTKSGTTDVEDIEDANDNTYSNHNSFSSSSNNDDSYSSNSRNNYKSFVGNIGALPFPNSPQVNIKKVIQNDDSTMPIQLQNNSAVFRTKTATSSYLPPTTASSSFDANDQVTPSNNHKNGTNTSDDPKSSFLSPGHNQNNDDGTASTVPHTEPTPFKKNVMRKSFSETPASNNKPSFLSSNKGLRATSSFNVPHTAPTKKKFMTRNSFSVASSSKFCNSNDSSSQQQPSWMKTKLRSSARRNSLEEPSNNANNSAALDAAAAAASKLVVSPTAGYRLRKERQKTAYESRLEAARSDLERREATLLQAIARGYLVRKKHVLRKDGSSTAVDEEEEQFTTTAISVETPAAIPENAVVEDPVAVVAEQEKSPTKIEDEEVEITLADLTSFPKPKNNPTQSSGHASASSFFRPPAQQNYSSPPKVRPNDEPGAESPFLGMRTKLRTTRHSAILSPDATSTGFVDAYEEKKRRQREAYEERLETARKDNERREATRIQALARKYLVRTGASQRMKETAPSSAVIEEDPAENNTTATATKMNPVPTTGVFVALAQPTAVSPPSAQNASTTAAAHPAEDYVPTTTAPKISPTVEPTSSAATTKWPVPTSCAISKSVQPTVSPPSAPNAVASKVFPTTAPTTKRWPVPTSSAFSKSVQPTVSPSAHNAVAASSSTSTSTTNELSVGDATENPTSEFSISPPRSNSASTYENNSTGDMPAGSEDPSSAAPSSSPVAAAPETEEASTGPPPPMSIKDRMKNISKTSWQNKPSNKPKKVDVQTELASTMGIKDRMKHLSALNKRTAGTTAASSTAPSTPFQPSTLRSKNKDRPRRVGPYTRRNMRKETNPSDAVGVKPDQNAESAKVSNSENHTVVNTINSEVVVEKLPRPMSTQTESSSLVQGGSSHSNTSDQSSPAETSSYTPPATTATVTTTTTATTPPASRKPLMIKQPDEASPRTPPPINEPAALNLQSTAKQQATNNHQASNGATTVSRLKRRMRRLQQQMKAIEGELNALDQNEPFSPVRKQKKKTAGSTLPIPSSMDHLDLSSCSEETVFAVIILQSFVRGSLCRARVDVLVSQILEELKVSMSISETVEE